MNVTLLALIALISAPLLAMDGSDDLVEAQQLTAEVVTIMSEHIKSPASLKTLAALALAKANRLEELCDNRIPEEVREHALSITLHGSNIFKSNNIDAYSDFAQVIIIQDNARILDELLQMNVISSYDKKVLLQQAVRYGAINCLHILIQAGVPLQGIYGYWSPLTQACYNGHYACAQALINAGVLVNAIGNEGATPLVAALENGQVHCLQLLIDSGATLNFSNALFVATTKGYADCIKVLIKAGANVNVPCKGDFMPLMIAAENGHLQCVQALLDAGADTQEIGPNGTSLEIAKRNGHHACAQLLRFAYEDFLAKYTPLHTFDTKKQIEKI